MRIMGLPPALIHDQQSAWFESIIEATQNAYRVVRVLEHVDHHDRIEHLREQIEVLPPGIHDDANRCAYFLPKPATNPAFVF